VRRWLRLSRIVLHLAAGCAMSALLYPLLPRPARLAVRRGWSRGVLAILNVRLSVDAPPPAAGSLLVVNHVSWLDAVVLATLGAAATVAKSETRRWPLLGRMLERNDTLFVERRPTRALLAVNAEIAARLARGEAVAVFQEGTTTDGAGVLAFRPALFEPAVRGAHPVQPLALSYRDAAGRRCAQAAYIDDMSLWQSLCRIAALPGLEARVDACAALSGAGRHRREAARLARAAIQSRICGGAAGMARQETSGWSGSGSAAGWMPSRTAPTWPSSTEVSRT
jgi:1-acyl-sn-glycerol-3-phosphate acyltransferase